MVSGDDTNRAKRQLRKNLRAARRTLSPDAQTRAAEALARHATSAPFAQAKSVVAYLADDGELDLAPLMQRLRSQGTDILLPRCREDGTLALVPVEPGSRLLPTGPAGILEPDGDATPEKDVAGPAVLLAPAVALDRSGGRLGRGGGSYDRLIPELRALGWEIVGVCHADHVVADVPTEPHDAPVDTILTERGPVQPGVLPPPPGRRS